MTSLILVNAEKGFDKLYRPQQNSFQLRALSYRLPNNYTITINVLFSFKRERSNVTVPENSHQFYKEKAAAHVLVASYISNHLITQQKIILISNFCLVFQ